MGMRMGEAIEGGREMEVNIYNKGDKDIAGFGENWLQIKGKGKGRVDIVGELLSRTIGLVDWFLADYLESRSFSNPPSFPKIQSISTWMSAPYEKIYLNPTN